MIKIFIFMHFYSAFCGFVRNNIHFCAYFFEAFTSGGNSEGISPYSACRFVRNTRTVVFHKMHSLVFSKRAYAKRRKIRGSDHENEQVDKHIDA